MNSRHVTPQTGGAHLCLSNGCGGGDRMYGVVGVVFVDDGEHGGADASDNSGMCICEGD